MDAQLLQSPPSRISAETRDILRENARPWGENRIAGRPHYCPSIMDVLLDDFPHLRRRCGKRLRVPRDPAGQAKEATHQDRVDAEELKDRFRVELHEWLQKMRFFQRARLSNGPHGAAEEQLRGVETSNELFWTQRL